MPSSFPTSIDSTTQLPPASVTAGKLLDGSDSAGVAEHPDVHETIHTAVIALETKVGVNGSTNPASLDANRVVLNPASSARNVIQSSADATELTLKKFPGQDTVPTFLITDENDNQRFVIHRDMEMLLGDGDNGITSYGIPSDVVGSRITEQLVTATGGTAPNGEYVEVGMTARVADDGTAGFGYLGILGKAFGILPAQGAINMTIDAVSGPQFYAKAIAAQALNLVQCVDVDLNRLFAVRPNGTPISNAHAAPADADLNNSDFATWLDDTPGATCLKIKAKDSGGTVRTASIPLT